MSMNSMWPFVRLIVNGVFTRSCFANTLKIQIKYFPHPTTGFYGNSILQEFPARNNNMSAPKVLNLILTWSCGGENSDWNCLMTTYYLQ